MRRQADELAVAAATGAGQISALNLSVRDVGAHVDRETQAFGLAVPGGVVSTTGVAGLTLGGGIGWLHRAYGLACDHLRSVEIVTADGQLRRASEAENPDLFWAVRGGGGNFGIVTTFEFTAHPLGPVVSAAARCSRLAPGSAGMWARLPRRCARLVIPRHISASRSWPSPVPSRVSASR